MLVLTTEVLPNHIKIKEIQRMIETTYPIEVSSKGVVRGFIERNRNEHEEAYEALSGRLSILATSSIACESRRALPDSLKARHSS